MPGRYATILKVRAALRNGSSTLIEIEILSYDLSTAWDEICEAWAKVIGIEDRNHVEKFGTVQQDFD